jgi:hypothetical protein
MIVAPIKKEEAHPWLRQKHYAKRLPVVMFAYGLYVDGVLDGVITYGLPPSRYLCIGICGAEYADQVLELNRLVLNSNTKNQASFLIGNSLKMLPRPRIIVSYADTKMGHHGFIYQATNFIYCGLSEKRFDPVGTNTTTGKHPRHNWVKGGETVERPRKHRYVYFVGDKRQKREYLQNLRYKVEDYPKGDNKNYDSSGDIQTQGLLL